MSTSEALHQISNALRSDELKVRGADRLTKILIFCAIAAATVAFLYPSQSAPIAWLCDLCFGLAIIFYITQRLGIFATFSQRQTLLAAELMFGLVIFGVFITINLAVIALKVRELIMSSMPH